MGRINHYFQAGMNFSNPNEQRLFDGFNREVINSFGFLLYYMPRQTGNLDKLFGEDASAFFDHYHPIPMYLENVDGYGGNSVDLSKFGIELRQTATFSVSRSVWEEAVRKDPTLQLPNRPAEGDLLYFPLTKSFFEIRKIENDSPFYQLGKLYKYNIDCELYQYSHEVIFTGDEDVDAINERTTDELQNLVLDEYGYALLCEDGGYILDEDYSMENIEPISDNDGLDLIAKSLIDFGTVNPFASIPEKK